MDGSLKELPVLFLAPVIEYYDVPEKVAIRAKNDVYSDSMWAKSRRVESKWRHDLSRKYGVL